ncbi:MAG: carbon storage regulator [Flavobacteriales bacterium]|nr:carbon storage regulator [Flavobacteriales bacterium]
MKEIRFNILEGDTVEIHPGISISYGGIVQGEAKLGIRADINKKILRSELVGKAYSPISLFNNETLKKNKKPVYIKFKKKKYISNV